MKVKYHNGNIVVKKYNYLNSNSSVPCVIPNRAFTIADLAYRMEKGLPLPNLTIYRNYEDTGLILKSQPRDIISAYNMLKEVKKNDSKKEDILNEIRQKQQQQQEQDNNHAI